jgi:membrane associated rhomboid family serine protease
VLAASGLLDSSQVSGFLGNLPKFRPGALALFGLTVAATAIIGDQPLGDALRLQPGALMSGAGLWQPFTANFVFPAASVGFILGSLFIQWLFGSELEGFWGTRKYVTLVLGCGTAGFLVYALLSPFIPAVPHGGSTAMDVATLTAFGLVYGSRQMSMFGAVTFKARTLAIVLVAINTLVPLLRGAPWPLAIPWIVAIAGGWLVTAQPWRRGGRSGSSSTPRSPQKKPSRGRAKPSHLKVVKDDLPN